MSTEWQVSSWNCGTYLESGRGYGLRLGVHRDVIDRAWDKVTLELDGGATFEVTILPGFWKKCPELRHPEIGLWLVKLGLQRWPLGNPHRFSMSAVSPRHFRVSYP